MKPKYGFKVENTWNTINASVLKSWMALVTEAIPRGELTDSTDTNSE